MKLILDLFQRIFIALQGVYTKAEAASALATKADATALTEEAQAREQADAKHDTEIDWLKTAVDGEWKTYMLARAKLTGIQKNIDTVNRAIKDYGKDNAALLPNRLKSDWQNLYANFEAWFMQLGEPTPLDSAFWVDYFRALDRWEKNPDETVAWTQTNRPPEEVVSLTNPNIVFLGKGTIKGAYNNGVIINDWSGKDAVIYTPNLEVGNFAFYGSFAQRLFAFIGNVSSAFAPFSGFKNVYDVFYFAPFLSGTSNYSLVSLSQARNVYASVELAGSINQLLGGDGKGTPATLYAELLDLHAPSAKTVSRLADYAANRLKRLVLRGGLPSATSIANMLKTYSDSYKMTSVTNIEFVDSEAEFPNVANGTNAFYKCTKFNQFIAFPALHTGEDMFLEAGMSAENISAVLDSLPSDPVGAGGTGVITFTGCPGAADLTQESASVAAATARGWTVEL
jgi:hypothetical protein